MGRLYSVTSGAALVAATPKVAWQLATGAAVQNKITQIDITFNDTDSTHVPVLVELCTETGASSGGSTYTPNKLNAEAQGAAVTTVRVNDTSDGSGPTVIAQWYVPPTFGITIQFPLAREIGMSVSQYLALRLTAPSACSYAANVQFEE